MKKFLLTFLCFLLIATNCFSATFSFRDEFTTARGKVASGTVTLANIRLSLVNGTAFVDFSAANVLTDHVGKYLRVTDGAGKSAWGYIKAAGTGETLDSEILANGSFTGTWASDVPQSWNLDGTQNATNYLEADDANDRLRIVSGDGSLMGITQDAAIKTTHAGKLLKLVSVWDAITGAGRCAFIGPAGQVIGSNNITTTGTKTAYLTPSATFFDSLLRVSRYVTGSPADVTVSDVSVKQVLTPSATGVTIVSTLNGTTQNWESIESGFDYNASAGYSYAIYTDASQVVNGSSAEPGVGTRTVTDTENKLSIANGALTFAGGKASPAAADPAIWFPAVTRAAGKALIWELTHAAANTILWSGWSSAGNTAPAYGAIKSISGTIQLNDNALTKIATGTYSASQSYQVAVVLRAIGAHYYIKGGTEYPTWRLLYVTASGNAATLYPSIANYDAALTSNFIRVPSTLWLPSPLVSDSFATTFGTTSGTGHAETSGLGSGGAGLAWSPTTTWSVSGAKAINAPVGTGIYTSNFSAGADDWGSARGTVAGNIDSIGGQDNVLRLTVTDTTNDTHTATKASVLTSGAWHKAVFKYYIPAGQSNVDGLQYFIGGYSGTQSAIDTWTTLTVSDRATQTTFQINPIDGGNRTFQDAGGDDVLYLKDVVVTRYALSELITTTETSTRDVIATVSIATSPAGTQAGLAVGIDSATDPKYGVIAYHDGTNAKLDKLVNGTWTNVISAAATWANDAEIRVIRDGTTFRLYYNNAQVGATSTIADVGDGTLHGLFSTYSGNQMDNFTVYARGTSGEYSNILSSLMQADGLMGGFSWNFGWGF